MIEQQNFLRKTGSPVLLVVEGFNDIEFLRRISQILHEHDPTLLDLGVLEEQGRIVFVPFGGGGVLSWTDRLAPLGLREWHLYDRELPPETDLRLAAVEAVNQREQCQAFLTSKRSLENYLHSAAIKAAEGIDVAFHDFDPVVDLTARRIQQRDEGAKPWELLSRRTRSRRIHRAKQRLNTTAVDLMSVDMLHESDPNGDIISWLTSIQEFLKQG